MQNGPEIFLSLLIESRETIEKRAIETLFDLTGIFVENVMSGDFKPIQTSVLYNKLYYSSKNIAVLKFFPKKD